MSALVNGNDAYRAVTLMRVDWDMHKDDDIVKSLQVPRRSTLVMFKDGKEVGRVVAKTSAADIESMFAAAIYKHLVNENAFYFEGIFLSAAFSGNTLHCGKPIGKSITHVHP